MNRILKTAGSLLWIAGLIVFIWGLNVTGQTGSWMTVTGNIAFFLGLLMVGIVWFRERK